MKYRLILPLLISTLLTGCAGLDALTNAWDGIQDYFFGKDNAEPPAELKDVSYTLQLTRLWQAQVGVGNEEKGVNLGIAVDDTLVYAADRRGKVQARNRINGDLVWEVDHELEFSAGPVVDGEQIFLATSNAEVVALVRSTGALQWKTTLSSEILSHPAVADDVVVVRTGDGHLAALHRSNGSTLWFYERTIPPLAVRSRGNPTIAGDLVIDGFGSGKISALQLKEGKLDWEMVVALPRGRSEIERLVDMSSTAVVRSDSVFVTGYQGGLASLGLDDGDIQWKRESFSAPAGMNADRRHLYLTDINSDVWQLELRNGADLWKQTELHQRRLTAPGLLKSYLVLGDFEGYLHVLSQDDGQVVGRYHVSDAPIEYPPVIFNDVVYTYVSDGTIAAFSVD